VTTSNEETLDIIWGTARIAAVINRTPRQTSYLLERGAFAGAARKLGGRWVASKRKLRHVLTSDEEPAA
jgi:hypothetical protein